MLNALRLYQPIAFELITQRTGLRIIDLEPALRKAADKDLLHWDEKFIYIHVLLLKFLK